MKLNSWIREVEFVKWNSWSWIREFVKLNSCEFVKLNSWSWIREFVKLKSWIREVEFVNSWSWNREFVKLKPWINVVEMTLPVFRRFLLGCFPSPEFDKLWRCQWLCCYTSKVVLYPVPSPPDDPAIRTNEPQRQKMYFRSCAHSEDSDQPAHPRSLIRIFTGRILDSQGCISFSCGQRRLWSDCVDAQTELSLR